MSDRVALLILLTVLVVVVVQLGNLPGLMETIGQAWSPAIAR